MDDRSKDPVRRNSRALTSLLDILRSGRPLVYIRSAEEGRVAELLRDSAQQLTPASPVPIWSWSLTEGLAREGAKAEASALAKDPREALDFIAAHKEPGIFHLKDFHEPLRDSAGVRRRLRDLYGICLDKQKFVVITSPLKFIPEEVERSFIVIDLAPPDLPELIDFLRAEVFQNGNRDGSEETIYQIGRALQGLSLDEARHAVRRALAVSPTLGEKSLPALFE
jgi:hypothetical protein